MKHILLFGAGKSATVLIDYLKQITSAHGWSATVADSNLATAAAKVGNHTWVKAAGCDILDHKERISLIEKADVVISMMPPALHILVAEDCIRLGKHLLTASYVDDKIRGLQQQIENKQLLFLCEMGLDPGIDHMSAMKIINDIHAKGGEITSFMSHCGGLVAPENDDNPWHYKISWNPRNVVLAGKAGALYKKRGEIVRADYDSIFSNCPEVEAGHMRFAWYPNRDSLQYVSTYGLNSADTFIRTTLRHPEFCTGWNQLIQLHLTDETPIYDTDGMSLQDFFRLHLSSHGFNEWLQEAFTLPLDSSSQMMQQLHQLMMAETPETPEEQAEIEDWKKMMEQNNHNPVASLKEANTLLKQLFFLGLNDDQTIINKGRCSAADVLQFALENKLVLHPSDKDMIVMLHEIEYLLGGKKHLVKSSLVVKGEDALHTAMAKTVGLPLGIAAQLILDGTLTLKGLHIPTLSEIYNPVLMVLRKEGIYFEEEEHAL